MMTKRLIFSAMAGVLALAATPERSTVFAARPLVQGQQDEIALALRNAGSHPNLGLPDFLVPSGDAAATAHAKAVVEVLWNDIDFEREYYLIRRTTSASIPVAPANALPFDRWAELGADVVLVGNATLRGTTLVIELRLVAVKGESRGREYFGVQYECGVQTARGPRDCAHNIADDFHKQVRGVDGVARTKLAFSSNRDNSRVEGRPSQTIAQGKEIYISDYDGANQSRFTVNRSLNINPSWGPGGSLLAYTSYSSGFPDIYVANLREPGRGLTRPAGGNDNVQNQLSSWSPDGSMLAFMSNRSGNNDVWVVNRDGSGMRNLTQGSPLNDGAPTWSPDGGKIAFTSDRAGSNQLYVVNVTGSGLQRIVDRKIDRPTWSRLNFIAFTLESSAGHEIGIYDFNNPAVTVLTNGVGSNESPTIAPNGRHIAFVTTRWGRKQIAVMDRTGQNIRRITEAGDNEHPSWQQFAK